MIPVLFTNRCSIVDLKGGLPGGIFKACSNRKYQYGPYYMSVNELYKVLKNDLFAILIRTISAENYGELEMRC